MKRARVVARFLAAGLLVPAAFLLSGCVYLRLLELKHQIAAFDRNFTVQTDDGVRIVCRNPVLLADDVRWIGLAPEKVRKVGDAELWQVRWIKQLPADVKEDGAFDIVLEMMFARGKLTRVTIPERYFAVMQKSLLVDLLRSLGNAKVDKEKRAVEARLASARPDLPGIDRLLGKPSSKVTHDAETEYHYRYVPAQAGGLAKSAVFDMTLHFDRETGQLRRWEGKTPVGRVGFSFER